VRIDPAAAGRHGQSVGGAETHRGIHASATEHRAHAGAAKMRHSVGVLISRGDDGRTAHVPSAKKSTAWASNAEAKRSLLRAEGWRKLLAADADSDRLLKSSPPGLAVRGRRRETASLRTSKCGDQIKRGQD